MKAVDSKESDKESAMVIVGGVALLTLPEHFCQCWEQRNG